MALAENRSTPWTFVLDEPTRILVVDDDPILREFASVYLATPYTAIDTASDGVAARCRLAEVSYDIILLDIEMPELDGLSLLQEIRSDERLRHLPVIMLTGHDDIASIDRAYHIGANSFAAKPVNWRQLSYQIRYVLRTSRLERAQGGDLGDCGNAPSEGHVATPATERDVRDFLQTVVRRMNSIEENLSALDRARWSEPLENIRSFAKQALAEHSGHVPATTIDGDHRTTALP
jgi:DNA-binding response OmpR family regulator